MGKEIATQVQEAQRVPYRINPKRNMPRHILIKLTKIKFKEKILNAAREKQKITYKGNPIKLSADFSAETLRLLRGKFIAIQSYLKKQEKSQINNINLHQKELEKEVQKNPKLVERKKS